MNSRDSQSDSHEGLKGWNRVSLEAQVAPGMFGLTIEPVAVSHFYRLRLSVPRPVSLVTSFGENRAEEGQVVEGGGLPNRCTVKSRTEGLNPSLSATYAER